MLLLWNLNPLVINAPVPITKVRTIILAPITLPKESWGFWKIAEVIPIKSSGKEVARAIRTEATINSRHFKNWAILVKARITQAPERTKTKLETIKMKM